MKSEPVGVTALPAQELGAIGVYQDANGIEIFASATPYLMSDGKSLRAPITVFDAGGPTYADDAGNAQSSMPVTEIPA